MKCVRLTLYSQLRCGSKPTRSWRHFYSTSPGEAARPVPVISSSDLSIELFRKRAFAPEQPVLIKRSEGGAVGSILAKETRWFDFGAGTRGGTGACESSPARLSDYLQDNFAMASLPYELMLPPKSKSQALDEFIAWLGDSGAPNVEAKDAVDIVDAVDTVGTSTLRPILAGLVSHHIAMEGGPGEAMAKLVRFEAPFALLMAALEFNQTRSGHLRRMTQLYIAQASLSDLPDSMQDDVPAPELVLKAGRGDIYASSLWLGLESTYTPWHRDPNPNLFVQLCSRKTVRVMPPKAGERVFRTAQMELMKQGEALLLSSSPSSSSRIRGEEMMQGPERELLHKAVWSAEAAATEKTLREAHLDAGDMLFIPKGWWHSVKSVHADGRLNGSANWWFR